MSLGRIAIASFALALFGLVGSCGGGATGPGPLRFHLDDKHIAPVPMSEKQEVSSSENDHAMSRHQKDEVESNLADAGTQVQVAANQRDQALIEERSARTKKSAADKTADLNRINTATREVRATELARRAADEKVSWLKLERERLRKELLWATENMYAMEARYELAKAHLAKKNNIQPAGFKIDDYEKQYRDRTSRAAKARSRADADKARVADRKKKYEALLREANLARGVGADTPAGGG